MMEVTNEMMARAADLAERFYLADFGGNDVAALRRGICGDSAIRDFVLEVEKLSATTRAELAASKERADALALQADEWEGKYAIASDMIHQLGENAAKAAGEYAERVAAICKELALTELANIEGASDEWLAGFRHAVSRVEATLALDTLNVSNLARAALTEPNEGADNAEG